MGPSQVPPDQGTSGEKADPGPHKAYDGDTGKDLEAGQQPKVVDGYPMPYATEPPRPPMASPGGTGPSPGGYPPGVTGPTPGGYHPGAAGPTPGGYPPAPGPTNKPESCCNIYWILFVCGLFTSIPVIIGSLLPMCMKPAFPTRCHRTGWYANIALLAVDIAIVIAASVVRTRNSAYYSSGGYGGYGGYYG